MLAEEYLNQAIKDIKHAKHHIYIITMIMTDDEVTEPFVDALCEASERGVVVNVAADMFTYAEIGGHFRFNTSGNNRVKAATKLKRRLIQSGAAFRWLGRSSSTIVNGRTHSKWMVIDDIVYAFGGVNLYNEGLRSNDYMLRQKNKDLATRMITIQGQVLKADKNNRVHRSKKFPIKDGIVILDGGMFADSAIYRRACHLAEKSTDITYVSQYCPTGRLGRLLKKTNSKLYFNHWNKASSLNALTIRVGSWVSGHQTIYNRDKYLHAKLMIFTLKDGKRIALSGSHNFSHGGVWLGTREIVLETSSPKILAQFDKYIAEHVD